MAKNQRKKYDSQPNNEITGVVLIIVSLLFLICIWTPFLGDIGLAVKNMSLGLLGYFAYALFVITLLLGFFMLKKAKMVVSKKRAAYLVCICLFFLLVLQLSTSASYLKQGFSEYIASVYDFYSSKTIGGIFFGVLAYALASSATLLGAYIVFSLLLALFLTLLAADIIRSRRPQPVSKRNYSKNKKSRFIKDSGKQITPIKPIVNTGLYVGNIIPKEPQAIGESGKFTDIAQIETSEEETTQKKLSDFIPSIKESNRPSKRVKLDAKEILFGDLDKLSKDSVDNFLSTYNQEKELDREALQVSMPQKVQLEPDIKEESGPTKASEKKKPDVVFPPQKETQPVFFEGEIINAEEISQRLKEQEKCIQNESQTNDTLVGSDYKFLNEEQRAKEFLQRQDNSLLSSPDINNKSYWDIINCDEEVEKKQRQETANQENDYFELPSTERANEETEFEYYKPSFEQNYIADSEYLTEAIENEQEDNLDIDEGVFFGQEQEQYTKSEKFTSPIKEPIFDYSQIEKEIEFEEEQGEIYKDSYQSNDEQPDFIEDDQQENSTQEEEIKDYSGYYVRQVVKKKFPDFGSKLAQNDKNQEQVKRDSTKTKKIRSFRYIPPPIELLTSMSTSPQDSDEDLERNAAVLEKTLKDLKLPAKVIGITRGPAVTRYELEMPPGYTVKKIEGFAQDIAYALASTGGIRIEAPIPGKRAVGVEVPNKKIGIVSLREMISSPEFIKSSSPLSMCIGKDIAGKPIICNLEKMPHLLVAGSTGSGKSACLHSLIVSVLYKASPKDVRLILIDPKRVEFPFYRGLRHLLIKSIINEREHAINAFKWVREEMEERYKILAEYGARNLQDYNSCEAVKKGEAEPLPSIVIIVDELSDLMQGGYKKEMEEHILSIAQKARASGVHLILATQRPSVDVITGTIKINLPSRIALAVSNAVDSKTILDQSGAEMLLGRGDLLYAPIDAPDPKRIQGAYVTKEEVEQIVEFINEHNPEDFYDHAEEKILHNKDEELEMAATTNDSGDEYDPLLEEVARKVIETNQASTSMMQRRFKLGYARASRIIDQMEALKFIGPMDINRPTKPREVYITKEMFKEFFGKDY